MNRISVRQLLREPKKYLIPGEFILTRQGADFLKVVLSDIESVRQDKVSDRLSVSDINPMAYSAEDTCKVKDCNLLSLSNGYCFKHQKDSPIKVGNMKGD